MADNVSIDPGTTTPIATDDVGGVQYQRTKVVWGPDGTVNDADVASGKPLPIQLRAADGTAIGTAEDVASGDGHGGLPILAVNNTGTPAATSGTNGDYEFLQLMGGKLAVAPIGFPVQTSTDITRPSDTTQYAANDAWSDSTSAPTSGGFTATSICRKSGGSALITDAIITTSNDAGTLLQGEIWLFNQAVTNINDNAAFAVSDSEIKTCVGKIPFTLEDAGNNGFAHVQNLAILATASGSANLRFLVRVKNTYTPASGEVLTVILKALPVD